MNETGVRWTRGRRARPRAVFFDLVGTLIEVRGGLGIHYAAIAKRFGVEADPRAIDTVFGQAFRSAGEMAFPHPDAAEVASLERKFWKGVVRGVFTRIGAIDRFGDSAFDRYFDTLFDYFARADGWTIFPDAVAALAHLRRSGLVVGLLTNFDQRVFPLLRALDLAPLLDSVTIPALAGAAKPDRAIFDYALARHALRPAEAVLVGDSVADDVGGAEQAGLVPVLVDRRGSAPAGRFTRIRSLDELPALLA